MPNAIAMTGPAGELARINAELAALMQSEPADMVCGADRSLADPLVICGILGGKDVGKSTLINALARRQVSSDHAEVGTGTTRPMAYVHRDAVAAYRGRFAHGRGPIETLDVTEHDADAIRNVVLVDLPDFDSDLPNHLETVRVVAPLLDRLIWVLTPRKIADRAWVSLFSTVIKNRHNVCCVLNKADELLNDDPGASDLSATFLADQAEWARDLIAASGCSHDEGHVFVLAAAVPDHEAFVRHVSERWGDPDWSVYGPDRAAVARIGQQLAGELDRLRSSVLSPVTRGDAESLKRANQRMEVRRNVETLRSHFAIEDWSHRLQRACAAEYHQGVLNDAFGADFCAVIGRRLRAGQRSETDLADDLMASRVEQWPILPIIFWPMRWLVRRVGARFAGTRWTGRESADEVFTVRGRSLEDRLRVVRARTEGDHARTIAQFSLAERLPGAEAMAPRIESLAGGMVAELDADLLDTLSLAYGRPSLPRRWLLWGMLIWFPVVQPLAQGVLKMLGAGGRLDVLGGLLQVVTTLGAGRLLTGLTFVGLVYVMILAAMYARCVAAVRRARRTRDDAVGIDDDHLLIEHLDELLVSEVVGPMSRPFVEAAEALTAAQDRLDRLDEDTP